MKANDKDAPWFLSEAGIRGHYASQRETEAKAHAERMKRINNDEDACLEAFRKSRGEL